MMTPKHEQTQNARARLLAELPKESNVDEIIVR